MHRLDRATGGFLAYPDEPPVAEPGFLSGAGRIGLALLALLAATTDVAPKWVQALLLDIV